MINMAGGEGGLSSPFRIARFGDTVTVHVVQVGDEDTFMHFSLLFYHTRIRRGREGVQ